jgi:UDP-N-acetylglucosamine 2-epimerase (non-hydrolysing)
MTTPGHAGATKSVLFVVGARPNFVKVAPVVRALKPRSGFDVRLVHTGQHYDHALSDSFVQRLDLPEPDYFLGVGSGSHAEQSAKVLVGLEKVLLADSPSAVVVPGDVNSTMAAAITAAKVGAPLVHLESGLRSRDWDMPEEVNRVATDHVSDLLLCHSEEAVQNLLAEGISKDAIALVGNTMIDSLFGTLAAADQAEILRNHGLAERQYILVTLHRPATVDDPESLAAVLGALSELAQAVPVVVPLHPRTRARLDAFKLVLDPRLRVLDPLDYTQFVALEACARLVVTDSGGIQEETSALGVPCLTYRDTTERRVTVELGTNTVVGLDPAALLSAGRKALDSATDSRRVEIPYWDGHAGERAADAVVELVEGRRPLRREWVRTDGPSGRASTAAAS